MIFMIVEPMPMPMPMPMPGTHAAAPAWHEPPPGPSAAGAPTPAPAARRAGRPWARALAAGTLATLAAFVAVQIGGCGHKTPLQIPKKAPAPKPAS